MTPRTARAFENTGYHPGFQGTDMPCDLARETDAPAGFARNARIITTHGLRLVQELRIGDRLITRGNGVVPIELIEQQSLIARAVYVISATLGHFDSKRDSLLPAGQPVLVRDWRARAFTRRTEVILPAARLIDGEFVRDIGYQPMTLFRIYCKKPRVLYADGMELVSADVLPFTFASEENDQSIISPPHIL